MLAILSLTNLQAPIIISCIPTSGNYFKGILDGLVSAKNTIRIGAGEDHLATLTLFHTQYKLKSALYPLQLAT